ncbi:MAG: transposase [Erysipelotrichaceae bacterium]|nr:transposase [Erysipelotrichaceae bacterium]
MSVREILKSMIQGEDNPEVLSMLAKKSFKSKKVEIERSLKGLMADHQRIILDAKLKHTEYLDGLIVELDKEVAKRTESFSSAVENVDSLPGIGQRSAEVILAEIGTDMSVFASERHISSWAGMCPGNNESAGKSKSGKTRKGNKTLRTTLVECARAASRTKGTYFQEQYHRIAARRGKNRAAVAVGHLMLNCDLPHVARWHTIR